MKHLIKSFALLMLLTSITTSRTWAQDFFIFDFKVRLKQELAKQQRAKDVVQDNEYVTTGYEKGTFLDNPLMLNGKPVDYGEFNMGSIGKLTVNKGTAKTGQTMQVPFYVYLRRNGKKVLLPRKERPDSKQLKVDTSDIFIHAQPGDQLVIEAVNKEDGAVKRILKLLGGGC
jgi:hypothetical protein